MEINDELKNHSKVTFRKGNLDEIKILSYQSGEEGFGEDSSTADSSVFVSANVLNAILDDALEIVETKQRSASKARIKDLGLFDLTDKIPTFDIEDQMYKNLTFRETLVIGKLDDSDELVPVGGICIDVQAAEAKQPDERLMENYEKKLFQLLDAEGLADHLGDSDDWEEMLQTKNEIPAYNRSKMLVHVSSQLRINDCNGGSNITSWVDRNLHTLEELRKEFFVDNMDNVTEQCLFTALKNKWYYVKSTSTPNFEDNRKLYSTVKARDYVSEGASMILQRYLAITGYVGKFELAATYINGDLCRNIYECFEPKSMDINGKIAVGYKIKRTIIEECGIIHLVTTILTSTGHILKQKWSGCKYFMYINPLIDLDMVGKLDICEEVVLKEDWKNDLELFSKYLDEKEINLMKNKSYLLDHPEFKNILEDYLGTILKLRPPDVITYTMDYFNKFLPSELPRMEYFD